MSEPKAPLSTRWAGGPFAFLLRRWRRRRRISQADLAQKVGVSSKHLSFLETGRTKPSRDMVQWIGSALSLGAEESARLAEAAGFRSEYVPFEAIGARIPGGPDLIRWTLRAIPVPAVVHDRVGTMHAFNRAFADLVEPFYDLKSASAESSGHQLLQILAPHLANWEEVAAFYRRRLERELLREEAPDATLAALRGALSSDGAPHSEAAVPPGFSVPIAIRFPDGRVERFLCSTFTFGAPQDIGFRDVRLAMLLREPDRDA